MVERPDEYCIYLFVTGTLFFLFSRRETVKKSHAHFQTAMASARIQQHCGASTVTDLPEQSTKDHMQFAPTQTLKFISEWTHSAQYYLRCVRTFSMPPSAVCRHVICKSENITGNCALSKSSLCQPKGVELAQKASASILP